MSDNHIRSNRTKDRVEKARAAGDLEAGVTLCDTIPQLLALREHEQSDLPWMIFYPEPDGRTSISYGEFVGCVRRTADLLLDRGIGRGDAIATFAHNHLETVVQYFAAWYLGAVVVPVNVGEDDRRITYILQNAGVKLVFVRSPYARRFHDLQKDLPAVHSVIESGEELSGLYPSYRQLLSHCRDSIITSNPPSAHDEALIVYTSGTTGHPKGVVLTQYNLLVDAKGIAEWHRIDKQQRMMCVLPIHHVNGIVVTLMTPLYAGASVVLNQKFHTELFFQRIAEEKVHIVSVVPTLLQFLLHEKTDHRRFDLTHFRHLICGAGPLTCELVGTFEDVFGFPIMHGYGLSETTCYSCFLPLDLESDEHRAWLLDHGFPSIGSPIPQNEMDIHSVSGESVGEGLRGEIVIRGFNVMKHYHLNPEANDVTFEHGWFRSGDEGFYKTDDRGRKFFFITGRIKELIIRGGVNIAPLEIDEIINSCPGVRSGIAVGFENAWYGEEVGALVVKNDPELSEADVLRHCIKNLPAAKCPKVVVFAEAIPVTSTGKYQRNKVRDLFSPWKKVQFR